MKLLFIPLLALVVISSTAFGSERVFPDTRSSEVAAAGGYPGYNAKTAAAFAAYMETPTHRRLLEAYSGLAPDPSFATYAAREIRANKKLGQSLVDGFTKLANDATKAGDARASTYRRAADRLAAQAADVVLRADAQASVKDALAALDKK